MKIKAIKISVDGNVYPVEFGYNNLEEVYNLISCSNIEIVRAFRFCENMYMICDGEALMKESPQINLYASYLYGADQHRNYICGDVLLCRESTNDEDTDFVSMTDDEISIQILRHLVLRTDLNKFAKDTKCWFKNQR
jgi:hypothetical protein